MTIVLWGSTIVTKKLFWLSYIHDLGKFGFVYVVWHKSMTKTQVLLFGCVFIK